MNQLLEKLPTKIKKNLLKTKMPSFEKPMLATLTKERFSDKDWIFERKFDGERCFIYKNNDHVFLKSRNDKSLDASYPELIDAAKKLSMDQIILDGEVVAFDGKVTSFAKLQPRLGLRDPKKALASGVKIYIYIFDILYLDGYSLLKLPLEYRKDILKKVINFKDPLRYTIHKNTLGEKYFKIACSKQWEGLIAKRRDGKYVHVRSQDWLKFKCIFDQELVIGGYTLPQNSRIGFGSLLLGFYRKGKLIYAGKVGTGFSDEFLKKFTIELKKIETSKNYFSSKSMETKDTHFVKPKFVANIGFENWTKNNLLRQPRFQGLRYDKDAKDVVQEKSENIKHDKA